LWQADGGCAQGANAVSGRSDERRAGAEADLGALRDICRLGHPAQVILLSSSSASCTNTAQSRLVPVDLPWHTLPRQALTRPPRRARGHQQLAAEAFCCTASRLQQHVRVLHSVMRARPQPGAQAAVPGIDGGVVDNKHAVHGRAARPQAEAVLPAVDIAHAAKRPHSREELDALAAFQDGEPGAACVQCHRQGLQVFSCAAAHVISQCALAPQRPMRRGAAKRVRGADPGAGPPG